MWLSTLSYSVSLCRHFAACGLELCTQFFRGLKDEQVSRRFPAAGDPDPARIVRELCGRGGGSMEIIIVFCIDGSAAPTVGRTYSGENPPTRRFCGP